MEDPTPWVRRWSDGDLYEINGEVARYKAKGRNKVHLRYIYRPRHTTFGRDD